MKRLFYILIGFALISCDKNELLTYEEGSGIYFDNSQIQRDTVPVSWGLKNTEVQEQAIRLEVRLIGQVRDYDRPFNINVIEEPGDPRAARPGTDYKPFPLEYTIPAGQASAIIDIDVLRSPDLVEGQRNLTIRLEESDELKFMYSRKLTDTLQNTHWLDIQRVLKITENFPQPNWWLIYGQKYFGDWSATKSILICDMMGIDRETWVGQVHATPEFSEGRLRFAGVYIHRWLQQQNPPVLDEDDSPMEMGPLSQR